eukprot:1016198-Rhodomonas_salina.1
MEHKNAKAKIDSPSSLLTDTTIRQLFETLVLLKRKGADMDVQVKVMVKKEADDQQGEHGAQDGDSWGEEEEAENLEEVELQPEGKGVGLGSEKTCGRQRGADSWRGGSRCDEVGGVGVGGALLPQRTLPPKGARAASAAWTSRQGMMMTGRCVLAEMDLTKRNASGCTLLLAAADLGDAAAVKFLLERGCKLAACDFRGQTALNYATRKARCGTST